MGRPSGLSSLGVTVSDVIGLCAERQVLDCNAPFIVAGVTNDQTVRDLSVGADPSVSIGSDRTTVHSEESVAGCGEQGRPPAPAAIVVWLSDLAQKALVYGRWAVRGASFAEALVVFSAKPARDGLRGTTRNGTGGRMPINHVAPLCDRARGRARVAARRGSVYCIRALLAFLAILLSGPVFAQKSNWFSTKAQQEFQRALTDSTSFGVPRYTTALLPTCNTANKGAVAFDTTLTQLVSCSGTAWGAAGGGGVVGLSAGSKTAPSLYFGTSTTGLYGGTNFFAFATGGEAKFFCQDGANVNCVLGSAYSLAWTSGTDAVATSPDTSIRRCAAGFPCVESGTGAAGPGALTAGTMTYENRGQLRSFIDSFTWTNAQVAALSGTAGDILLGTLKAKQVVKNMYVVITGTAAGPTTVTVSCGRTGASYIDYIVASDAKVAANTVYGDASGERGTNLVGYDLPSYTATTAINCHFISTGANLSTTTGSTGRVIVEVDIVP